MSKTSKFRVGASRIFSFVCAVGLATALTGCIRQLATITSDPPCAKTYVNGVYRGETPVEVPYNWNWYYDIKLEKPGYETLVARERFYAPAKHVIPFDFFAELWPGESREDQWRHYTLCPARPL